MRSILLSVLLLFVATSLFAQKDSLRVVSHWKNTDIRSYKVTQVNSRNNDSGQMISDTVSYLFRFVVLDSTATGYRIKWEFDESPLYDLLDEDEYDALQNQYGDLTLIYTTDHNGVFKNIENWQDISRYYNIYYDSRYAEDAEKDSASVIESYKQMKEAISTREGVEAQLFNEMQFFHFPFGHSLPLNDTLRYPGQMQLASSNEYAMAHVQYFFSQINREKNEATLNKLTSMDTDDAEKKLKIIIQKNLDTMPVTSDSERKDKAETIKNLPTLKFDSKEQVIYKFNYKTGFPLRVYFKLASNFKLKDATNIRSRELIIEETN